MALEDVRPGYGLFATHEQGYPSIPSCAGRQLPQQRMLCLKSEP